MSGFRIAKLHAYVAIDENGEEGVCAAYNHATNTWMPMVCADEARIKSFRPIAENMAKKFGRPIKLVCFTVRKDVEVIK